MRQEFLNGRRGGPMSSLYPGDRLDIANRLRLLRRAKRIRQSHVADDLGLSVSEISRIERGRRRLRADQVAKWAKSLGYRIEMVFWESTEESSLDEESLQVLHQVASALKHMPKPARAALVHEMNLWREEGTGHAK